MAAAVLAVHCQLHWPVHHHIVILGQVSNVNHDMRRGWETHTHITLCHTVSHCLTLFNTADPTFKHRYFQRV